MAEQDTWIDVVVHALDRRCACCRVIVTSAMLGGRPDFAYVTAVIETGLRTIDKVVATLCPTHRPLFDVAVEEVGKIVAPLDIARGSETTHTSGRKCSVMEDDGRPDFPYISALAEVKLLSLDKVVDGLCETHRKMYDGGLKACREQEAAKAREWS